MLSKTIVVLALNATLSKSKYVSAENEDRLCSAGFDMLVAFDWVVCDTLPPANEASPCTLELEHPLKPKVSSTKKPISCFLTFRKTMSKPFNLLLKVSFREGTMTARSEMATW
jgi:hypothetical protein